MHLKAYSQDALHSPEGCGIHCFDPQILGLNEAREHNDVLATVAVHYEGILNLF